MDASTLLRNAGWFPGRTVDVSRDLAALSAAGYEITPAAAKFLAEYSGLTIVGDTKSNPLIIDGAFVAGDVDPEWGSAYAEAIGTTLVAVGEYSHMTLYIDAEAGLWGAFDSEYGRGGSSLEEVVQGIFLEPRWRFDRHLD